MFENNFNLATLLNSYYPVCFFLKNVNSYSTDICVQIQQFKLHLVICKTKIALKTEKSTRVQWQRVCAWFLPTSECRLTFQTWWWPSRCRVGGSVSTVLQTPGRLWVRPPLGPQLVSTRPRPDLEPESSPGCLLGAARLAGGALGSGGPPLVVVGGRPPHAPLRCPS